MIEVSSVRDENKVLREIGVLDVVGKLKFCPVNIRPQIVYETSPIDPSKFLQIKNLKSIRVYYHPGVGGNLTKTLSSLLRALWKNWS